MKGKWETDIWFNLIWFYQLIYFQHLNQLASWNKISVWITFIKIYRVHFNNCLHSQVATIFIWTSGRSGVPELPNPGKKKQNNKKIYYVWCLLLAFLIWNRLLLFLENYLECRGYFKMKQTDMHWFFLYITALKF